MLDYYGETAGIRIARKHLGWYTYGLYNSNKLRHNVNCCNNATKVKDIITDFYTPLINTKETKQNE